MLRHIDVSDETLKSLIRSGKISFGGNRKLRIYGTLSCKSGKRIKKENRVFFNSVEEAVRQGFRPCGHCMKSEYKKCKNEFI